MSDTCPLGGQCHGGPCVYELGAEVETLGAKVGDFAVCEDGAVSSFRPHPGVSLASLPLLGAAPSAVRAASRPTRRRYLKVLR